MALWPNRSHTYLPGPMVIKYTVSAVSGGAAGRRGSGADASRAASDSAAEASARRAVLARLEKKITSIMHALLHCLAAPLSRRLALTASRPAPRTPTGKSRQQP